MPDIKDVQTGDAEVIHLNSDNEKLQETLRGYRVLFFNPTHFLHRLFNVDSIRVYDKSILALSRYGDDLYTKTKNRMIKDREYLTYSEQLKLLKERGIWDEQKEADLQTMREKARKILDDRNEVINRMAAVENTEEAEKLKKESMDMMQTWVDLYSSFSEIATLNYIYFKDTIEMQAEIAQRKGWLVTCLTHNEGDDKYDKSKRLWKDIDDLDLVLRRETMEALLSECISYWESYAREESFFAGSPEELILGSVGEFRSK